MVNDRVERADVREMEEIDLLELFRDILKHIKLIIVLCILFGLGEYSTYSEPHRPALRATHSII